MSLFNTLRTGASGLGVSGRSLSVIGDNIANLNTTGYKSNRASFADALPQNVASLGGPATLGSGAVTAGVTTTFSQGLLQGSGSPLDVAIQGRGFFQVANGPESFYTRDGSFHVDQDGWLVNNTGLRVQGYPATNGQIGVGVDDIQISTSPVSQKVTENIAVEMALAADTDFSTTPFANLQASGLDGLPGSPTLLDLSQAADFSTSVTVYDSLGVSHDVTVFFERSTADTWSWSAAVDGGEVNGAAAGSEGVALEISSGNVTFDTDGVLTGFTQNPSQTANWPGADPWTFDLQLGLDPSGTPTDGEIRMMDSSSAVTFVNQDGYTSGDLAAVRVDGDGTIRGTYTNGEELALGKLALALFQAEGGLDRVGGNLFRATANSGQPAMGMAEAGGRGMTTGHALERSNVELEDEFVGMIQGQRSYQANAGVIRTADETLQELVNLV